jgi:uncharacterized membrane protein
MEKLLFFVVIVLITMTNVFAEIGGVGDFSESSHIETINNGGGWFLPLFFVTVFVLLLVIFFILIARNRKRKNQKDKVSALSPYQKMSEATGIALYKIKEKLNLKLTKDEIAGFTKFNEVFLVDKELLTSETDTIFWKKRTELFQQEFALANKASAAIHLYLISYSAELKNFALPKCQRLLLEEIKNAGNDIKKLSELYHTVDNEMPFYNEAQIILKRIEKLFV